MKRLLYILFALLTACTVDTDIIDIVIPQAQAQEDYWDGTDTIFILSAGQSNCIARCAGTGGVITLSDSVEAWNGGSSWVDAAIGTAPFNTNAGNYALSFANEMWENYHKYIRIVKVCHGGNEIENWLPPINDNMDDIEAELTSAGIYRIDVVVWLQGEANHDGSAYCNNDNCYRTKLDSLVTVMRGKSWFGANGLFIAGQLYNGTYGDRNGVIAELNDSYADKDASAPSDGCTSCDGTHLTGECHNTLGIRMYDAFIGLASESTPPETPIEESGTRVIYVNKTPSMQ